MKDAFENIVNNSLRGAIDKKVDYIAEDGFWHCGHCGQPKQMYIHCLGRDWLVSFVCKCQNKNTKEREDREKRLKKNLADCFGDDTTHQAADDEPMCKRVEFAKKYAEKFTRQSKWLVIYGNVGTGKSYRAAQICRDIIRRDFTAKFTSLSEIERRLWDSDKSEVYKNLDKYDALVLDDFGSERQTQYTAEIRYNIVDMRYKNGKPLIITTNVAHFDSDDISDQRVYSRIKEKSFFLKYDGQDRRSSVLSKADIEKLLTEGGWEDL